MPWLSPSEVMNAMAVKFSEDHKVGRRIVKKAVIAMIDAMELDREKADDIFRVFSTLERSFQQGEKI